jgi:hypothetical protein
VLAEPETGRHRSGQNGEEGVLAGDGARVPHSGVRLEREQQETTQRRFPRAAAMPATTGWIPPTTPIGDAPSPSMNGIAPASMTTKGWTASGT